MPAFVKHLLAAYAQIFFSKNSLFGLCLLVATFCDPVIGASGLAAAAFSLLLAALLRTDASHLATGSFTFNAVLSGLAVGSMIQPSGLWVVFIIIVTTAVYLLTLFFAQFSARVGVPFLSLPFIAGMWLFIFHLRQFFPEMASAREVTPDAFSVMISSASASAESLMPVPVKLFFRSLGAIVFQRHVISGMLIAAGLICFSRIAMLLAITGFAAGYLYLGISQAGTAIFAAGSFNFILSALAIGGFFFVPTFHAFIVVVVSTVITSVLFSASSALLWISLPVFSLPFALSVIVIVTAFGSRTATRLLRPVVYQNYNPEKNLYRYLSYQHRFRNNTFIHIHLPFFGEWKVSQAHHGDVTHKGEYAHAWDFVVADEHARTFRLPGKTAEDFYCYGAYVLAAADGKVVRIEDGVDDNPVGGVNLPKNWGNTIIIRHAEDLYSKISHIKKHSFRVKEGDDVKTGTVVAVCGNSGRSPEPHVHFQLQSSASIGSPTIHYPISYYSQKKSGRNLLRAFDIPQLGDIVSRPQTEPRMKEAFTFHPGSRIQPGVSTASADTQANWISRVDALNNSYLECMDTGARMYYYSDEVMFQSTSFSGDRSSTLYWFYIATRNVPLCTPGDYEVSEILSPELYPNRIGKLLQDLIAPFYIFLKPIYKASVHEAETKGSFTVLSSVDLNGRRYRFEIAVSGNVITSFTMHK